MLDDTESGTGRECSQSTAQRVPVSLPEAVRGGLPAVWTRRKDTAGQQKVLDVWTIVWHNSRRLAALGHTAVHVRSSTRNQPLGHLMYNCISADAIFDQVSGPSTMWRMWRALTGR
jgi:hypothetical protein